MTHPTTDATCPYELSPQRYLIIGQGDIGLAVTNSLVAHGLSVMGMARAERSRYALDPRALFLQADASNIDLTKLAPEDRQALAQVTHLAIIVAPSGGKSGGGKSTVGSDGTASNGVDAYERTYLGIAKHLASLADELKFLQRVVFVSSTGVYGQDAGEWIDVHTEPVPSRPSASFILQAEQVLHQAFGDRLVVVRPSGIYGLARQMRLRQALADTPLPVEQAWSNRIMDSDLVTILCHVMTEEVVHPVYLASDYAPVTSTELVRWLRSQLSASSHSTSSVPSSPIPTTTPPKTPTTTPTTMATSTVTGKRIHSNIPLAWLAYPDWQSGYAYLLSEWRSQGRI